MPMSRYTQDPLWFPKWPALTTGFAERFVLLPYVGTKLTSSIGAIVAVFQVREVKFGLAVHECIRVLQVVSGGQ